MLKLWPSDINPGTGTSILIAVAASTYLILQSEKFLSKVAGKQQQKQKKLNDISSEHCEKCKSKVEEVKDSSKLVTCRGCGSLISREKCGDHIDVLDTWRCISCKRNSIIRQRTGEWFLRQLRELTDLTPQNAFVKENALAINPSHAMQIKIRLEKVRELTEQYLAKILNGSLEDILVGKISNDVECLPNPIPDANQNDLKRFINRICQEVVSISNSLDYTGLVANAQDDKLFATDPKTYEQLVATAVLNKITENYHGKRNLFDISSDETNVTAENEEELILQDFERYQSQIQNREISLPNMLDKDLKFENDDGSWEDNWFFKLTKQNTDGRIAMLVPSPIDDNFKPLIGDKNIDEINDSDNESSSSFSNFEYENPVKEEEISTTLNVNKSLLIELPVTEPVEKLSEIKKNEILIDNSQTTDKINKEITKITNSVPAIKDTDDEALFEVTANETNKDHIDKEFEEILMDESYIVPGSIAEREKIKWRNAAPIANNPYSSEALEKRLSKIKLKNSILDGTSENLTPTPPPVENEDDKFQLREDITKYKRDYYINNDKLPTNGNHEKLSTPELNLLNNESIALQSPQLLIKTPSIGSPMTASIKTDNETSEREDFSSLSLSSDDDSKVRPEIKYVSHPLIKDGILMNGNRPESPKDLIKCETYEEKLVIEPEVVEFLPSVKKLAKLYSQEDEFEEHIEPQTVIKSASENKIHQKNQIHTQPLVRPVFASITARSLPTKVRTELKKSLTQNDIPVVSYSERNESPDIESGVTRKSIAYFEKLYS
ncbi:hypothetical protein PVAND_009473 [Polypedilum vanderplanki]|uniref:Uncharacterized protein n=1 Tax=Polypedilum vanderplanki TaxID=319348 RepID=A0A9J6CCP3_POLVA|nr:hypothetical protein PVAND_009473 [Polypedilum vanderplanki]